MINRVGNISLRNHYPYIYFIIKDKFLYIGQTQSAPVKRWGAHVTTDGSFSKCLRERGDIEIYYSDQIISFLGYACTKIFNEVPITEHRIVTQYIEHVVHVKITCHPVLGTNLKIVSDTTQSAVHKCKYSWADELSKQLVELFYRDYSAFSKT